MGVTVLGKRRGMVQTTTPSYYLISESNQNVYMSDASMR